MNTNTLFKEEKLRDKRGRFCTKEQFRLSNIIKENKRLRLENEKYIRAWHSARQRCTAAERELNDIVGKLKGIIDGY